MVCNWRCWVAASKAPWLSVIDSRTVQKHMPHKRTELGTAALPAHTPMIQRPAKPRNSAVGMTVNTVARMIRWYAVRIQARSWLTYASENAGQRDGTRSDCSMDA